jgi:hypothetical protein
VHLVGFIIRMTVYSTWSSEAIKNTLVIYCGIVVEFMIVA